MEKFDFGLPPSKSPLPQRVNQSNFEDISLDTNSGAEQHQSTAQQSTTPSRPPRPEAGSKNAYSLFPKVSSTTTPIKPVAETPTTTPTHTIKIVESSYRPRKESLSSSVRSRKDSFTSFCGSTRRIPMRILSSAKTNSTGSGSGSGSVTSPQQQSRWSTSSSPITSPLAATTPGPRTSFGSLLERDSGGYPACFFEDDDDEDEAVPLRRKFGGWKRSASLTLEQKAARAERFGERESFGRRVGKVLLCWGCCGER